MILHLLCSRRPALGINQTAAVALNIDTDRDQLKAMTVNATRDRFGGGEGVLLESGG